MTLPHAVSALMPINTRPDAMMVRGQGAYVWDHNGKRYLDFVQGWAVNCLGHAPPSLVRALSEQAGLLWNASPAYYTAPQAELAQQLTARAAMTHAFFCSSGAEANEGAIKLARRWGSIARGGAHEIITTVDSFHGRTLATMAASGKVGFATRFPPMPTGFKHVPFGDLNAIEQAIGPQTVAVMLEPIQGEAGVVVPPPGYLSALRALTHARGLLLIADEIQTGIGRTGTLFGCEHEGVAPDIMTLGKGLGGGFPLAALLARREVSCFTAGDQGGTYNGHPLACAVGLQVLRELTAPEFLSGVQRAGAQLSAGLARLASSHGGGEVRGRGLLWALNLPKPVAAQVVADAFARGLLLNAPRPTLLRFMPALNVSASEIESMLGLLDASLRAVLPA